MHHRNRQGNEQTRTFEPTNKSADYWSAAHLAVVMSLVVVMTLMHGENLLKKQTNTNIFYYNLESKNLSMPWRHHRMNSHQSSSGLIDTTMEQQTGRLINLFNFRQPITAPADFQMSNESDCIL